MRLREMSMLVLPWLVLVGAGCGARTSPAAAAAPTPGGRSITLAELRASVGSLQPSTVVFDIDDTSLSDPAIRAIRIIRSPVSYNERPTTPGRYREEILTDSAD